MLDWAGLLMLRSLHRQSNPPVVECSGMGDLSRSETENTIRDMRKAYAPDDNVGWIVRWDEISGYTARKSCWIVSAAIQADTLRDLLRQIEAYYRGR